MTMPPDPRFYSDESPLNRQIMQEDWDANQERFKEAPTEKPEKPKKARPSLPAKTDTQTCYQCGESVAWGHGRFVNRVPADMPEGQEEWSKDPGGQWLCAECHHLNWEEDQERV